MTQPLSQQLRAASKKDHKLSDSLIAARLVVTATDKRRWATALTSFWYVIDAVEKATEKSTTYPGREALLRILPRIRRAAAFQADLQTFFGPQWREKIPPPSAAVRTYLERVTMISTSDPHLLLAHAYTQHVAILAGGQILRRSVRSSMQLGPDDPGTAIFELPEPASQLKSEYKQLIDGLEAELGPKRTQQLIEEHRLVFRLNNDIVRDFPVTAGGALKSIVKLLPPEVLLLAVSVLLAAIMVSYTRKWVVLDPAADDFRDPDAILT